MENTEEKIKEMAKLLHSFSNAEMKQKIEQWFPECFKQKLEVGKWYQSKDSYAIYFIEEILNTENENRVNAYGFNNDGIWSENANRSYGRIAKCFRLATTEEVESMLIKEAEKRGLIEGVKINKLDNYYYGVLNTMIIGKPKLELDGDILVTQSTNGYNTALMKDGKWATIVETPKEMTLEEIEKQLGHKVKIVS